MEQISTSPRVFVSHASEDKERFVLGFATRLRSRGIEAWVDKWEMYPGDSLVDKIFEEGIKNAQAVIVVISKHSAEKPWVREELNVALVKKIQGSSKLIPVIIDDCDVPECLRATVWEKINDLDGYDAEFERIVMSIYGHQEKPPLGEPPAYTQVAIDFLPDLTKVDSLIFKLSCEKAVELGHGFVETDSILSAVESLGIHNEEFFETLEVLDRRGYIGALKVLSGDIPSFSITTYGFDQYARIYLKGYESIFQSVALQVVNAGQGDNASISSSLDQPKMIVDHILELLELRNLINVAKTSNGGIFILGVSPELKRMLRDN